jgi:hypothetical protein
MSEGVRVGLVSELKIGEKGPVSAKVGGLPVKAWQTLKDFNTNMQYPNPAVDELIDAARTGRQVAFAGWEKIDEYEYTDNEGVRRKKQRPTFYAQRVVQASENQFGEVFQQAVGGTPPVAAPPAAPFSVPPGENPAKFYPPGGGGTGAEGTGEGLGASTAPASPTIDPATGWVEGAFEPPVTHGSVQAGPIPTASIPTPNVPLGASLPPSQPWLNDSYDLPYKAARITAIWAVGKVYEVMGDTAFGESAGDPNFGLKDRARHLAAQAHAIAEALVKGEL